MLDKYFESITKNIYNNLKYSHYSKLHNYNSIINGMCNIVKSKLMVGGQNNFDQGQVSVVDNVDNVNNVDNVEKNTNDRAEKIINNENINDRAEKIIQGIDAIVKKMDPSTLKETIARQNKTFLEIGALLDQYIANVEKLKKENVIDVQNIDIEQIKKIKESVEKFNELAANLLNDGK